MFSIKLYNTKINTLGMLMGIIIFSKLSLPKMSHKTEINLQLKKKKKM